MPKNYYLVLGITSTATADDIKEAYRRLAKEFHPDYYGENQSPFLAIQEAYSVLSDPIKRQSHDQLVRQQKEKQYPPIFPVDQPHRRRNIEPLIPGQTPMDKIDIMNQPRTFQASRHFFDQFFDHIFSKLNQW
ncbi:MAG: DnaJ domain-containing protein [Pseudomonadota bacterium]